MDTDTLVAELTTLLEGPALPDGTIRYWGKDKRPVQRTQGKWVYLSKEKHAAALGAASEAPSTPASGTPTKSPVPSKGPDPALDPEGALAAAIARGEQTGTVKEHKKEVRAFLRKHRANYRASKQKLLSLVLPGSEVTARVKTIGSGLGKMARDSFYDRADKLLDGTGMRVVVQSLDDVYTTIDTLKKSYKQVAYDNDYIKHPKPGSHYRSYHVTVIDDDDLAKEIQVRTPRENTWADWSHDVYKPTTPAQSQAVYEHKDIIETYARTMSDYLYDLDSQNTSRPKPPCPPEVQRAFGCL